MFEKLRSDIEKSEHYHNKLKGKEWVKIYYQTLYLLLDNLKIIISKEALRCTKLINTN